MISSGNHTNIYQWPPLHFLPIYFLKKVFRRSELPNVNHSGAFLCLQTGFKKHYSFLQTWKCSNVAFLSPNKKRTLPHLPSTKSVAIYCQYLPKVQFGQWQIWHMRHRPPSARFRSSSLLILSPAKIWGSSTSNTVVGSLTAAPGIPRMGMSPR